MKPKDLKIVNEPEFLTGKKYKGISYVLFIAYALMKKTDSIPQEEQLAVATECLDAAISATDKGSSEFPCDPYHEEDFLEIMPCGFHLSGHEDWLYGLVVVDESKGCFPLVCYPEEYHRRDRRSAFVKALGEVRSNLVEVMKAITAHHHTWDDQIKQDLFKACPFEDENT